MLWYCVWYLYCTVGARAFAEALNDNDNLVTLGVKAKVSLGIEDQIREKLSRNTENHIRSRDAFREVLEKGHTKVPWNRAKLMVVGQGKIEKFHPNWNDWLNRTLREDGDGERVAGRFGTGRDVQEEHHHADA